MHRRMLYNGNTEEIIYGNQIQKEFLREEKHSGESGKLGGTLHLSVSGTIPPREGLNLLGTEASVQEGAVKDPNGAVRKR